MEIRAARPDDIPGVLRGYEWLFAPPGTVPEGWDAATAGQRLAAAIAGDGAEILIAEADGAVVGICSVYHDIDSVRFGRRAWVEDLAVDPGQRSRGIGKALLDEAKNWARAHGASHLELDSAEARVDAHRFYER